METKALLKKESPLREIWEQGKVPIKSPVVIWKQKGEERVPYYEVDLELCSEQELNKILEIGRKKINSEMSLESLVREGFAIDLGHTRGFLMSQSFPEISSKNT